MMILKESGADFEAINYYIEPIPKKKLKKLLTKMKLSAKDILRTKEPIYKELKLAERDLSEDELINLLVKYPDLIQRPIVEKGKKAILARPAERIKEIL
jgi:arsenate reductase (glutaredoxin)